MANTTFEERRLLRVGAAERAETKAKGHHLDVAKWERQGKTDKAAESLRLAKKFDAIGRGHRAEAERLEIRGKENAYRLQDGAKAKAALEARAEAQKAERPQVDPLQAYIEATQHAQRHEETVSQLQAKREGLLRVGKAEIAARLDARILKITGWADNWRKEGLALIALSGRDLAAEWEAQVAADSLDGEARRARVELKLPLDLRTAGAQREFVAGSDRRAKVVSFAEYATLIPRPHARTSARLNTMAAFDRLCSWAEEGLLPSPSYEPTAGSGSTKPGSYQHGYAGFLQEMDALGRAIGGRNVEMLKRRIYGRQTLTQLARDGFGTEKTVGILILAAVDAMAVHFAGKPDGNVILAGRQSLQDLAGLAP